MTKVSIVGVRGSGKTVLLAALGDKYELPDKDGLFFKAKDSETFAFVKRMMSELRDGRWPVTTGADQMQDVNWAVMRRRAGTPPVPVGAVSMLDFAGEVYATAFGDSAGAGQGDVADEVARLREYVATSDVLVVLVNIADLCNAPNQTDKNLLKALWASMGILDFAAKKGVRRVAIGLSQFERFRALAEACGGPLETLRRYAPFLFAAYGHLPLFTLTAVDKTVPGAEGKAVPAREFGSQGIDELVAWMLDGAKAPPLYRVIDLSTGREEHLDEVPSGGWTDEHKTTKLVLRRIEPGTFLMGSPEREKGRDDDETQHRVTLTKPYYMGVFPVTRGQWRRLMGSWMFGRVHRPVVWVSWEDCQQFCQKAGLGLRLPTEAEWEYACRAGTTTPYAGTGRLDDMGWFWGNTWWRWGTTDVGVKRPNDWGLYDMHGNVWEWCADWLDSYGGDATDPTGPASGWRRVCRGGSWIYYARDCRSASRSSAFPGDDFYISLGFRLACSARPSE